MLLNFDFTSDIPLYMQLRNQIVIGIAEGRLQNGEKLPTIRSLSEESGINMMTVSKAYQLLKQEGYIITDRRKGTVVRYGEQKAGPSEETLSALRLHISELRLAGMSRDEVLKVCAEIYEEGSK